MRWIVRLVVLALLLALGLRVSARHDELARVSGDFENQRQAIGRAEADLDDLDQQVETAAERLRDLDQRITEVERTHGGSIPRGVYDDYLRLVNERNEAASEHNTLLAYQQRVRRDYEDGVDRHNSGVAEANGLARRLTPWSVLQDLWDGLRAAWERG